MVYNRRRSENDMLMDEVEQAILRESQLAYYESLRQGGGAGGAR
jgi:hypothetical protein